MTLAAMLLIPLLAALSAAFAMQGIFELRQRQIARSRALGMGLGPSGPAAFWREARLSMAAWLELRLPEALRGALASRLAQADSAQGPGALAFDMACAAALGLALGLLLNLDIYTLAAALLGLALPFMRVSDAATKRQNSLRRDLPDALDLLTACVEAGLAFDQALARVAQRLKGGFLKKELEACVASMGVGASRREALRELERRAGLDELAQVVSALIQADKRGVPLGPALRAQSAQLRALRSLRVKKLAAEAPLKMLFPLMAFILPVVFIVLFGPIILKWQAGGF